MSRAALFKGLLLFLTEDKNFKTERTLGFEKEGKIFEWMYEN